jgi:hypothetical protein
MARERARAAVYDVQSYMQLTKIEAVSRNHDCRFVLNTATRTIQVIDTNGTSANLGDDFVLHETTLPERVNFVQPGGGSPVTLKQIGTSSSYETVFTADGIVSEGTGSVTLFAGQEFSRVTVLGAGGVEVEQVQYKGTTDNDDTTDPQADGTEGEVITTPILDPPPTTGGTGDEQAVY